MLEAISRGVRDAEDEITRTAVGAARSDRVPAAYRGSLLVHWPHRPKSAIHTAPISGVHALIVDVRIDLL